MGKSGRLPVGRLPARLHLDRVPSAPAGTPAEAPGFRRDFPPQGKRSDAGRALSLRCTLVTTAATASAAAAQPPWARPAPGSGPTLKKGLGSQITAVPPPLFLAEPGYFGKASFLAAATQIDAAKTQRFLCLCACFQQDYDVTDECWRERERERPGVPDSTGYF